MFAVSRFRYADSEVESAHTELASCLERLRGCPGFLRGSVGRAMDDPGLWALQTSWESVGAYRRALSSYDITLHVMPLLAKAIDEPSAYEVIIGEGATTPNVDRPREV
ncbi:MAG: antibiotic biosynthesis monooxygenase [Nocardioidaceae bacterium]